VRIRPLSFAPTPAITLSRLYPCRLLSAHLVHYDLAHLLTNIGLLLPSCSALEAAQGPAAFTADLLLLAVTASTAYGAAALLRMGVLGQRSHYYSMVTVGASSLSFALMVRDRTGAIAGAGVLLMLIPQGFIAFMPCCTAVIPGPDWWSLLKLCSGQCSPN